MIMLRRSRTAAFRGRNLLLQLFDSPTSPPPPRGSGALNYYSSKASPFSETLRDSLRRASAYDHFFIKRKVQVRDQVPDEAYMVAGTGSGTYIEPDIGLRYLVTPYFNPDPDQCRDPPATIARFALEVCSNQTLTRQARRQAVRIIYAIARYRPDSLERHELVNPILQAMLPSLVREEAFEAQEVVKRMALNHPEQVFSSVLEFASHPKYLRAAVTILGHLAEVCPELMKDKLEHVVGIVVGAHRDRERRWVRSAAWNALHKFVEHLRPEIVSQCHSVLPCILSELGGFYPLRQEFSYFYSLELLCDSMTGEEILPFLDPIINRLLPFLREREIWKESLSSFHAMCSVAAAADQHFVPYAERVLEVLTCPEEPKIRPENLVFAGLLVTTVGRAGAEPMLAPCIGAAVSKTANSWNNKLIFLWGSRERRYTYGFFCTVAETLSDGFAKYLSDVVPLAIHSCSLDEDDPETRSCSLDEDDDDDDPETRSYRRNSLLDDKLDEKAAAARALGLFAVHTKSAFAPYLEESMSVLINLSAHYHEDVRLQGFIGLKNILTAAAAVSESPSDGAAKAKQLLGTVMDHHIKAMDEDGDMRVVAQVCTNTAGILEDLGYAALEPYMPQIIDSAVRLLQGKSACQRADDSEHKETLMAAGSNLLAAFVKAAAATSRFAKVVAEF